MNRPLCYLLALAVTAGCATAHNVVAGLRDQAVEAAEDQARVDGVCRNPSGKVLSGKMTAPPVGKGDWIASGRQAAYLVQVNGCGKEVRYDVTCIEGSASCKVAPAAASFEPPAKTE